MKNSCLFFSLFLASHFLSAQDTLFSKDFNNLSLEDDRAYIFLNPDYQARVFPMTSTVQYEKGNPALVFNLSNKLGNDVFGTKSGAPALSIQLNTLPSYDTVWVSMDIWANQSDDATNMFPLYVAPYFNVIAQYQNPVTAKSYSRSYQVKFQNGSLMTIGNNPAYLSLETTSSKPFYKRMVLTYVKQRIIFEQLTVYFMFVASEHQFIIMLPSGYLFASEQNLKATLLTDFCNGTDNVTDCKAKAKLAHDPLVMPDIDFVNGVLVDNISIVGKNKKIVTDLENAMHDARSKEIEHAYTPLGIEINDYAQYTGLAILHMKDGSRKKCMKH